MLVPAGRRLQADGRAARGRDRDRPRADGDASCCARPASSASSSSTSATGSSALPLADRATIGNMSPEYGATCGFFPVDDETLAYLRLTGRDERAGRARRGVLQGERALARPRRRSPTYSQVVELDLGDRRAVARRAAPTAGPRAAARGEARRSSTRSGRFGVDYGNGARRGGRRVVPRSDPPTEPSSPGTTPTPERRRCPSRQPRRRRGRVTVAVDGEEFELEHGSVVIAAITSCTNTSNPQVMVGAGLLAKKAVERGLHRKPWVKSSLAPGSKVVTEYYEQAGLDRVPRRARLQHRRLRLHDVHRQLRPAAGGDLRRRSPRATSSSARCSRATATSRRASIPR